MEQRLPFCPVETTLTLIVISESYISLFSSHYLFSKLGYHAPWRESD